MKKLLLFIALTIFGLGLNAQNVTIDYDGYSLAFRVTSVEPAECEVSGYTGEPVYVTIPSTVTISGTEYSVTSIGYNAFRWCTSLTSIEIPNSVTYIGDNAFWYCSSLTSIEISNSVTSIGDCAFGYCSSLTSIEISNSVTYIGDWAFSSCSSLTSIEIPNSVTYIGIGAFSGCSSLTSIEIPNSVTSIGYRAFVDCSSLTSIEIPNSVTSIGHRAFEDCSSLTSIEIPNSVTSIGEQTFFGCSSLTSIEIPNSVTSIGSSVFYGCYNLTSIEIPNSVTSIGEWAFSDCSSLTSIEIPNSVTSIGEWAFSDCSSLTSITFGENSQLTSIGRSAFSGCSSLRVIKCYAESVPETGYDIFGSCPSDMIIYVPENSVEDYKETSPWNAFTILSLNEGPRNITATTESVSSVNLSWDNCYADSYNVYRNGDSIIANVTNTTYTDICLEYNTEYCYTVTAVRNETETDKSEEVCAKTFDLPITTPENLVAEALSTSSISLTWDAVENALSYNVYSGENKIANVIENTYIVNELNYYTDYCFTVTAVRNETESDKSEEICTMTFDLPITTPENLIANVLSTSSIILTWDNVENALSYNIYRDGEMIINVTNTNYTDNNLEYNTEYCYTVTAVRNETESDKSEEKCVKTFDLPITTPENLIANVLSTSSISLSWNEVENALSYNVYRNGDSIANVTNPTYTDVDLEYNTEYCYTVTAVRNETESDKSEEKCAKTFDLPITTPENLVAEALSTSSISLSWNEVENALSYNVYQANELIANVEETTFTVDGLEYNTEYCYTVTAVRNETESDKSEEKCVKTFDLPITTPENLIANVLSTSSISLSWDAVENALSYNVYQANEMIANVEETTFTVDGLEYNTEYCYTVTAVRNETESDKSEEKCVKTLDLPITTPENLIANVLSTSSIILTWDNVENALSYNVYRDGEMIINVTNTNYTDNNLEYNTEYCYIVTAVRNETESDKSEEKCAKTFDLPITTPENLIANVLSTSSIILTWDNVENALSYNVYRDDEMIINVTNTNYTDNNLEYNTEYCYTVTAVRNETESDKSEEVCAKTLGESINELSSSINIYPNPVENELFIATEMNVKEVAIYDVYGRLCCRDASNASTSNSMDTFNVSVQDLEAGIYFVNVKTENGNIVKKFVKK